MRELYCELCAVDGTVSRLNALGRCPVCTYADHGQPQDHLDSDEQLGQAVVSALQSPRQAGEALFVARREIAQLKAELKVYEEG